MYKGKPLIIGHRPFWRNPIFPWGLYSMTQDKIAIGSEVMADGHLCVGDEGGGLFKYVEKENHLHNNGTIIIPSNMSDTACIRQYEPDSIKSEWFGAKKDE